MEQLEIALQRWSRPSPSISPAQQVVRLCRRRHRRRAAIEAVRRQDQPRFFRWTFGPVVDLQAMHGIYVITAVSWSPKISDFARFADPRQHRLLRSASQEGMTKKMRHRASPTRNTYADDAGRRHFGYSDEGRTSDSTRSIMRALPKAVRDLRWQAQVRTAPDMASTRSERTPRIRTVKKIRADDRLCMIENRLRQFSPAPKTACHQSEP